MGPKSLHDYFVTMVQSNFALSPSSSSLTPEDPPPTYASTGEANCVVQVRQATQIDSDGQ